MTKKQTGLLVLLFFLAIFSLVIFESLGPINFKEVSQSQIISLLTSLFVIAAFLERALEVYISTSRGPGAMQLDNEIVMIKHEIETKPDSAELKSRLMKVKQERELYRLETKKRSLWVGLLFGVLISAVGIRTLGVLVAGLEDLKHFQQQVLNIIDVLLTGGLLAGGSDGLHKFSQLYNTYMNNLNQKIVHPYNQVVRQNDPDDN